MITEEVNPKQIKVKGENNKNIDVKLNTPSPFLDHCGVYCISGSCGSGKSFLTNSLLTSSGDACVWNRVFDNIFYIVPEEVIESDESHPFRKHTPSKLFHELTPAVLNHVAERAKIAKANGGVSCVVIEDFTEKLRDKHVEKALKRIINKHRHLGLNVVITLLNLKGLGRQLRSHISCWIIFKPKSKNDIREFGEEVFGFSKEQMNTLYDYAFQNKFDQLFYNQIDNTYYRNFNKLTFN
jgi:hypothetical protein